MSLRLIFGGAYTPHLSQGPINPKHKVELDLLVEVSPEANSCSRSSTPDKLWKTIARINYDMSRAPFKFREIEACIFGARLNFRGE